MVSDHSPVSLMSFGWLYRDSQLSMATPITMDECCAISCQQASKLRWQQAYLMDDSGWHWREIHPQLELLDCCPKTFSQRNRWRAKLMTCCQIQVTGIAFNEGLGLCKPRRFLSNCALHQFLSAAENQGRPLQESHPTKLTLPISSFKKCKQISNTQLLHPQTHLHPPNGYPNHRACLIATISK